MCFDLFVALNSLVCADMLLRNSLSSIMVHMVYTHTVVHMRYNNNSLNLLQFLPRCM